MKKSSVLSLLPSPLTQTTFSNLLEIRAEAKSPLHVFRAPTADAHAEVGDGEHLSRHVRLYAGRQNAAGAVLVFRAVLHDVAHQARLPRDWVVHEHGIVFAPDAFTHEVDAGTDEGVDPLVAPELVVLSDGESARCEGSPHGVERLN